MLPELGNLWYQTLISNRVEKISYCVYFTASVLK